MLFDEFNEFLGQVPTVLFIYICIPVVGLSMAIIWFAWIKPRMKKANEEGEINSQSLADTDASTPMPTTTIMDEMDMEDMPDLNMLVNPSAMKQREAPVLSPTPPPESARAVASAPIQKGTKYQVRLHTGDTIESEEVVSVLRDPRDGRLVVYIENTGYRTLVDTPDVKAHFVQIMKELSDVVTQPDNLSPTETESAPEMDDSSDTVDELRDEIYDDTPTMNTAPPPPINADGAMPGDLPSFKMEDYEGEPVKKGRFGRAQVEYQAAPELDIAGAIEAYLQHKIRHTPEYNGRNIHVHSAPDGGVRIEVDGQFYEAVSDVANPEDRAFLSATIQEWQDRQ